jgi:hypothetical protein
LRTDEDNSDRYHAYLILSTLGATLSATAYLHGWGRVAAGDDAAEVKISDQWEVMGMSEEVKPRCRARSWR